MIDLIPLRRGVEEWRLDLVERTGEHVATLDMLQDSGSDTWQAGRATPHSMSCQLGTKPPMLRGRLLRATYTAAGQAYPLGVWLPRPTREHHTDTGTVWSLTGLDQTHRLAQAALRRPVSFPMGTPIAEAVRSLVAAHAPGLAVSIEDTDDTLRTPMTFDAGKTVALTVANKLLEAAGHTPLRPRANGTLWSSRLVPASERAVAMEWRDGLDAAPFEPELELPGEMVDVPNEVIAIAPGGGTNPGLVGYWSDPAAIERYGRLSLTIDIEATSQLAADRQARQRGLQPVAEASEATITGPWQPIDGGEIAELVWSERGIRRRAEITGKSTKWAPSASTTYTTREAL